jgi:hypothetical protein
LSFSGWSDPKSVPFTPGRAGVFRSDPIFVHTEVRCSATFELPRLIRSQVDTCRFYCSKEKASMLMWLLRLMHDSQPQIWLTVKLSPPSVKNLSTDSCQMNIESLRGHHDHTLNFGVLLSRGSTWCPSHKIRTKNKKKQLQNTMVVSLRAWP